MSSKPTLADVARLAGVHKATASRALSADAQDKVSAATAERIRTAAASLGYQVNAVARSLAREESKTVAVLVPDLTNALFPPMVRGIENVLSAQGFVAFLANTDEDPENRRRAFDAFRARRVDGFIFATAMRVDPLIAQARKLDVPAVMANRRTDIEYYPSVTGDDASGVRQVIEHLFRLGHRRIGHISGPTSTSPGEFRRAAFAACVAEFGLDQAACPIVEVEVWNVEQGNIGAREMFRRYPDVTAVFAANDMLAVGVLEAAKAAAISVPRELSVVGFNDMPFSSNLAPGLTTVALPAFDLGVRSAELLLEEITGRTRPASVLLEVSLVLRESTATPK